MKSKAEAFMRRILLLVLFAAISLLGLAQDKGEPQKPVALPGGSGHYTVEVARVEEVLKFAEDGYLFTAYMVTWHGAHVIVSDPLSISNYSVGDEVKFMAHRLETAASPKLYKVIHFTVLPHPEHEEPNHK
jgi:hypothetical protein